MVNSVSASDTAQICDPLSWRVAASTLTAALAWWVSFLSLEGDVGTLCLGATCILWVGCVEVCCLILSLWLFPATHFQGLLYLVAFCTYGIALWYSSRLVSASNEDHPECIDDPTLSVCFSGGIALMSFFAVQQGMQQIGMVVPVWSTITTAAVAASRLYEIIDEAVAVDDASAGGGIVLRPEAVRGEICFKNVTFAYPSRPDDVILRDFSLTIVGGRLTALVGDSGSGKSTLLQLILRMYEPQAGEVTLDGVNVRDINLASLRSVFGVVAQEPRLFNVSIYESIAMGAVPGTVVSAADVDAAAASASVSEFVGHLANGMQTVVGERGGQLSGGQKQRVAIARAMIRRPRVWLLDEATSALDTRSERDVQAALDGIMKATLGSTTTVSVAHRLSTIVHYDTVVVMRDGGVVETGPPAELLQRESVFARCGGGS